MTDLLQNAISSGKIAHAYLLTGPRGTGKTSVARIIAHEVNGLEYSEDTNLDIIEIDAASNRRIDDIRELRDKVHIAPVAAKFKVYIIDEVHMLTGESFNALLKTLEEPPEHAIFILATTEVHKVPATIVSRTQRYHFRPANVKDIVKHLRYIASEEKIDSDTEALELIATHANGSFRDSVSLLDQLSGLSETITAQLVESVLGMAPRERVDAIVRSVQDGNVDELLSVLEELESEGISSIVLASQLNKKLSEKARQDHELFVLVDAIVDSMKAYDPQLKLLSVLVKFAQTNKPHLHATSEISLDSTSDKKNHDESAAKKSSSDKKMSAAPSVVPPNTSESSETEGKIMPFDWGKVLETAKKHHKPLHSVLSRAQQHYDGDTLTLTMPYALHRKKLENPTYRNQLAAILKNLFALSPEITVQDTVTAGKSNKTVKAVADIMGGGEIVDAKL